MNGTERQSLRRWGNIAVITLCSGFLVFWILQQWAMSGCINPHLGARTLGVPSGKNRPDAWALYQKYGENEPWSHFKAGVRETILSIEANRSIFLAKYGPAGVPAGFRDPLTGLPMINRGCVVRRNLRAHDIATRATVEWYAEHGTYGVNSARRMISTPNQELIGGWANAWANAHGCNADGVSAYKSGVLEVIESIRDQKECFLEIEGWSRLPDFEPEFGMPVTYSDLILVCQSDAKEAGKRQALSWYSTRGMLPRCSVRSRIPDSIPEWLIWTEFGKQLEIPDAQGRTLTWDEPNHAVIFKTGNRSFVFHRLFMKWQKPDGPKVLRSAWAWDAPSQTVFLRLVGNKAMSVFQLDFENGKVLSVFPSSSSPESVVKGSQKIGPRMNTDEHG